MPKWERRSHLPHAWRHFLEFGGNFEFNLPCISAPLGYKLRCCLCIFQIWILIRETILNFWENWRALCLPHLVLSWESYGYLKWRLAHSSWSHHPLSGVIIQPFLHLHELSLLLPSFSSYIHVLACFFAFSVRQFSIPCYFASVISISTVHLCFFFIF